MNELICTLIIILVGTIMVAFASLLLRCGPQIVHNIKSFIRWNRNKRK